MMNGGRDARFLPPFTFTDIEIQDSFAASVDIRRNALLIVLKSAAFGVDPSL
jgi:hypothetical protein